VRQPTEEDIMKEQIETLLAARYDAHDKLWLQKGVAQQFAYSDGDETENRIHDIVTRTSDVSLFSAELRAAQTDWASRYHLSATRANLLRPLASILSGSVLEIGSGCGAISRFLGELGADVIGVEGSSRRASIAAARCRDLPNVNIVNEVFDDFPAEATFDAVTLIGVLEYASIFGKTENAALTWLKKAYQSLEAGGHLVIAIENQLGLKYLAGMPEDHLAKAMFGINDLYAKGTATTYGRVELTEMLREAGFGSVEVALPFPDYKLPTSVVLPRAYDGTLPSFDASAFARQSVNADAQLIHAPLFSLGQAWGVVGRNALLPDLSNSFLVVARKGAIPADWALSGPVAQHFATERLPIYCKQVDFIPEGDAIFVRKTLLAPDVHAQDMRPITLTLADEAYIPGANHCDEFERIVSRPGWEIADVAAWFGRWQLALDQLLASTGFVGSTSTDALLPDWAIDALPRNLMIRPDGRQEFIDLEWGWRAGVEYGYLAYRAITVAMASISAIAAPANERHVFIRYVMEDVLRARGIGISATDLERYVELDGLLRKLAFGSSNDFTVRDFSTFQVRVMPDVTSLVIGSSTESQAMAARLQTMSDDRAAFEADFAKRCSDHARAVTELDSVRAELARSLGEQAALKLHSASLATQAEALAAEVASLSTEVARVTSTGAHAASEARREAGERAAELAKVLASKSWRMMAPLRVARRLLGPRSLRQRAGRVARASFRALPLDVSAKQRLKNSVFRALSPALKSTTTYEEWKKHERVTSEAAMASVASSDIEAATAPVEESVLSNTVTLTAFTDEFVPIADSPVRFWEVDVRLLAFYLPQFHPIAENDAWWGRGFTEWTNVSKASPQFPGHHQPQLPGELGFYDLRLVDVMARQVELARLYGVSGFCFHYYWFGGRRLLERPVNQFLEGDIDFPFCICWANENWTRRWDGMDGEILIGQNHSAEDDLAFIEALAPLIRDPRYIRVNGKPLVIVYRPSILPDAAATALRWREYCREAGLGEIFLGMVQFDVDDPTVYGFDAAIEFPPHKLARNLDAINHEVPGVNPDFAGTIIDYEAIVERASQVQAEGFNLFRGVFPSWDNEARKPGRGYLFHGATPERYGHWLRQSLDYARKHPVEGEKMVFVNAWNEWAEGAHLEPDRRYGYAFLQATRDALLHGRSERMRGERIVLVSHDAYAHGAQYLALHIARELRETFGFEVDVVCLGDGPLIARFREFANVHVLAGVAQDGEEAHALAQTLAGGARHAIVNSTASGLFAGVLGAAGMQVASLVHELPGVIRDYRIEGHAKAIASVSRRIFFPAAIVREGFSQFVSLDEAVTEIHPQGLFTRNRWRGVKDRSAPRAALRQKLRLPQDAEIILAVGYADMRKGVDLFVEAGLAMLQSGRSSHFVWVGHADVNLLDRLIEEITQQGYAANFHFVGMDFNTDDYYAGADVYALASREDPFPSVVLEALSVGLPVVAFAGAGGAEDIVRRGCGLLVPTVGASELAMALSSELDDAELRGRHGDIGSHLVSTEYSFRRYLFALLDAVGLPQPKVTAVVPNYNYAHLLAERLRSIDEQTVPVFELIVLDDCSSDDSLSVLSHIRPSLSTELTLVENSRNSGSVFRQWLQGASLAEGDFIWIAEADDSCEKSFLQCALAPFVADSEIVLSFTQSKQVNGAGQVIADDYLSYTSDVDGTQWAADYVRSGGEEIREALAIKNTIPNVSAVLFKAAVLRDVLHANIDEISSFRIAGDWLTYLLVASGGKIAFTAEALNRHRRHESSVTLSGELLPHLVEVLRVQKIARDSYCVGEDVARRAWDYAEALYASFGLTSTSAPSLADNDMASPYRL
jgi:glycosyltransferase involved in cell wall biosynthesis/SAM-dependent methyltransferase